MSVVIIDELIYLKIANTLKLSYGFINKLYRLNQKAYVLSYNESSSYNESEINDLPSLDILKRIEHINDTQIINIDILILKTKTIRYNIYSNGGNTYADKKTLEKLDNLILFLQVRQAEKELNKLNEVKT